MATAKRFVIYSDANNEAEIQQQNILFEKKFYFFFICGTYVQCSKVIYISKYM